MTIKEQIAAQLNHWKRRGLITSEHVRNTMFMIDQYGKEVAEKVKEKAIDICSHHTFVDDPEQGQVSFIKNDISNIQLKDIDSK